MRRLSCEDTFIIQKRNLSNGYFSLTLGPFSKAAAFKPGQFIHLKLPEAEVFFRRAFSVASVPSEHEIEIILKVVGRGTSQLSRLSKGARLNVMGPLGNPFLLPSKKTTALVVAGGIGFPPLYFFMSTMMARGHSPKRIVLFYGGKTATDILERSRIKKLGVRFQPVTEDGSLGEAGLVTTAVEEYIRRWEEDSSLKLYACGPPGMLKAVDELGRRYRLDGQLSLEAPMPCGMGLCLGCVVPLTGGGNARVCVEGPVFNIGEVRL